MTINEIAKKIWEMRQKDKEDKKVKKLDKEKDKKDAKQASLKEAFAF